ncbi:MAG: ABC transporter permease [Clostridia bacterium]|nr:ABC transporter permease [Clostridia bacterium]
MANFLKKAFSDMKESEKAQHEVHRGMRLRRLFIAEDFRSGYAKNLFTVRAKKSDYVISKTLMGFLCGASMLILYFIGSALGGAIAGLSFDLHGLNATNLLMCLLSKIFLMPVFVSIFTLISVAAKKRAWLSICASLGGGMLLFMTVSMITPLSATIVNAGLCLAGGLLFALGIGALSTLILKKQAWFKTILSNEKRCCLKLHI